ncbi:MAG: glycosyltransferase family 2 protein [Burkholderiales bacterium]
MPPRLPPGWCAAVPVPARSPPADGALPRITVVTPSYNQAAFLETTIRSVLEQGYPALDYHVIDGGSNDGSVDILRHYGPWLTSWVSEPDRGQVDAILKGLRRARGEWFNWINSDDLLAPGALWDLAAAGDADLYAGATQDFREDSLEKLHISRNLSSRDFVRAPLEPRARRTRWHQPGTWLRTAALREVEIDPTLHYRFDLDLMIQYLQRFPRVLYGKNTLAWFRLHADSKTVSQREHFYFEHVRILERIISDPSQKALRVDARQALSKLRWRHELHAIEQDESRSRLNRLIAIVLAAGRKAGAWRTDTTYKALHRALRGDRRRHTV